MRMIGKREKIIIIRRRRIVIILMDGSCITQIFPSRKAVSYTHLTLPTTAEV